MAIEILGFTIRPELSIGDIAAIGALIASPLIFYFGYSRTRKSEQIKIVRELIDRIEEKKKRVLESVILSDPDILAVAGKIMSATTDLIQEIDYFFYLLNTNEIEDENTLQYSLPKVASVIPLLYDYPLEYLRGREEISTAIKHSLNKVVDQQKKVLGSWLDKYDWGVQLKKQMSEYNPSFW